jgi:hypothetical protein
MKAECGSKSWKSPSFRNAVSAAFFVVLFLPACASTLAEGAAETSSQADRREAALGLEARLKGFAPEPIIIGIKSGPGQDELVEINSFVGLMNDARFIVGGRPSFQIEFESKERRESAGSSSSGRRIITFTVQVIHVKSRKAILQAEQEGLCLDSTALVSYPLQCTVMKPLVLRRALESLQ